VRGLYNKLIELEFEILILKNGTAGYNIKPTEDLII